VLLRPRTEGLGEYPYCGYGSPSVLGSDIPERPCPVDHRTVAARTDLGGRLYPEDGGTVWRRSDNSQVFLTCGALQWAAMLPGPWNLYSGAAK
jgi:hypothetical protein